MNWSAWYRWVVADRAFALGLLGGTLTSLAGIIGYIVLPVLTGDGPNVVEASLEAAIGFMGLSAPYHVAVLVIPPFLCSLGGVLTLRRWGVTGRWNDAKLLGGIVTGPLLTVCLGYVVTAVGIGLTWSVGDGAGIDGWSVLGLLFFTYWALIIGLILLAIALPAVMLAEGVAALLGYLCATAIVRFRAEGSTSRSQSELSEDPPPRTK